MSFFTLTIRCVLALAFTVPPAAAGFAEEGDRGTIEVQSRPEGASVYVEGFFVGSTPVSLTDLPERSYRVVVKDAAHADYVEDVVVVKKKTTTVNAELATEGPRSPVWEDPSAGPIVGEDARKPYEKAKSTRKLRDYSVLQVTNFQSKSEKPVAPDYLYSLFSDMARALDEKTEFRRFVTSYTKGPSERWGNDSGGEEAPTLVLSGVLTEYEPGSQTTRYLVGFGAGKTRVYCLFRLVDKVTGEVVFERMENGSVSMGLLGGSGSGAMKELGEDLAKAIRSNW
jgi:hypothetical protein